LAYISRQVTPFQKVAEFTKKGSVPFNSLGTFAFCLAREFEALDKVSKV